MLWVVQNNLYNEYGYKNFLNALDRMKSNYVVVKPVPIFLKIVSPDFDSFKEKLEDAIEPHIDTNQKIVICGAITLGKIAIQRGWTPGTFLNENFDFNKWCEGFGKENLLNGDSVVCKLKDAGCFDDAVFSRPTKDTKAFTGTVMSRDEFYRWKENILNLKIEDSEYTPLHGDTEITISSVKNINAEYRIFIVDGKIVTGSVYKQGTMGISYINTLNTVFTPDDEVMNFTQQMIDKWQPADCFVVDIAKTDEGPKVIEINNLNSAGFYSCDVFKIIDAVERYIEKI